MFVEGDGPQGPVVMPDDVDSTLQFSAIRGRALRGTMACNQFSGSYDLDGEALELSELGVTDAGCDPALHAVDEAYVAALLDLTTATRDGDRLELTGPDSRLVYAQG